MARRTKERIFRVVYERDEDGWHAEIPSVRGCHTWGKSIGLARRGIREALATCVEIFGDEATADAVAEAAVFEDDIRFPARVTALVAKAKAARAEAHAAEERAAKATRRAVEVLAKAGVGMRDAATLLGMSHQRVHQLRGARG
jgi:predicted RNase H-like HicB family nuclease